MIKNVLLLTVDCLRADHLSCLGYERDTSPNIDDLAKGSALFSRAYSQGTATTISFPSMFSGIHTLAGQKIERKNISSSLLQYEFPGYFPYLPEILKGSGYRTAGFHANALVSHEYGYQRGFDEFFDGLQHKWHLKHKYRFKLSKGLRKMPRLYRSALVIRDRLKPMAPNNLSDRLQKKALDFIERKGSDDDPYFAWVHYMDAHHPLIVDPDNCREVTGRKFSRARITRLNRLNLYGDKVKRKNISDLMALYDTAIWETDSRIGSLLDRLKESGRLKDTAIILTSDHGEAFMEHGTMWHKVANFHDEQIHVPLIVGGLESRKNDSPVSLVDLTPTILNIAGIDQHGDFTGRPVPHDEKIAYSGAHLMDETKVAVTTRKWRYIWSSAGDAEMYDLDSDPMESENLASGRKDGAEQFEELIKEHLRAMEAKRIELTLRKGRL